jgi:hypothetical protein
MIFAIIGQSSATVGHQYVIMGMIAITIAILSTTIITAMKALKKKGTEMKLMQQQHIAKIDMIRKEQSDVLEKIRLEMLKREEERTRQWMESEKEALHVLNGVSIILDLSDKLSRVEGEKLMKKLEELQTQIKNITSKD